MRFSRTRVRAAAFVLCCALLPAVARAQSHGAVADALIERATITNPAVRAARERVNAARARVGPAGQLPDPMISVGVMNMPLKEPGFGDFMTMKTVGVTQMVPYPGRRVQERRMAERAADMVDAGVRMVEADIRLELLRAYYDIAFVDRALQIAHRHHELVNGLLQLTESRYAVGAGPQSAILRMRVEAARLAEEAAMRTEERVAAAARLNALLSRTHESPIASAPVAERVSNAALNPAGARFVSAELGARVTNTPLRPLAELHEAALQRSPELGEARTRLEMARAASELAGKAHLPDFEVSLQYGQRSGMEDMVSVMVAAPLPLRRGQRQSPLAAAARADLTAAERDVDALAERSRAAVSERVAMLERIRSQLALFSNAILPQGRAALESATTAFTAGRGEFELVLEHRAVLHEYEIEFNRLIVEFGRTLAELERLTGAEVLK